MGIKPAIQPRDYNATNSKTERRMARLRERIAQRKEAGDALARASFDRIVAVNPFLAKLIAGD